VAHYLPLNGYYVRFREVLKQCRIWERVIATLGGFPLLSFNLIFLFPSLGLITTAAKCFTFETADFFVKNAAITKLKSKTFSYILVFRRFTYLARSIHIFILYLNIRFPSLKWNYEQRLKLESMRGRLKGKIIIKLFDTCHDLNIGIYKLKCEIPHWHFNLKCILATKSISFIYTNLKITLHFQLNYITLPFY
jgi:hypothetical protein